MGAWCNFMTTVPVAGIGAASICGVYGTNDTAESPVPAAMNSVIWLMFFWGCCLMELVLFHCGGQPPKRTYCFDYLDCRKINADC